MNALHQRLQLYTEGNDAFIFVPTDASDAPSLTVYRSSGDIVLDTGKGVPTSAKRTGQPIYGILGSISLTLSEYIVVITGRELRGRIAGNEIYRATTFDILPLNPNVSVDNSPHPVEAHLLGLLRSHLAGGYFLFSYTYALTQRLQAQWQGKDQSQHAALWQTADDRFFWNKFLQTRFIEAAEKQDLGSYILPVMYGTFDIRPIFLHGRHMHLALISRRSRFRAGTRYFRRGIDDEGHVANFNETEQMLLVEPAGSAGMMADGDEYASKFSFVQIRGSIPLFWAEVNNLRYKPDLQIMDKDNSADAMKRHLTEQTNTYGHTTLVSLVNHKGHEQPIKEAYERTAAQLDLPNVQYEYFDFHTECKNMRWDRISLLVDKIQDSLETQGYFHVNGPESEPVKSQQGVVRTNCMDNLDRTNVVQATLAKYCLMKQLREIGILPSNKGVDDYEELSHNFREMWANHADSISAAYAGSGALKSDFTRTNKRTHKGALEDGVKSVTRYLKNNYFDGPRQDAFDLFTGAWIPRKNPALSTFLVTDTRPIVTRAMPLIAFFASFMICAGFTLPRTSTYSLLYYFLLWFTLLAASLAFIVAHGIDYVAWPRLNNPGDIIFYNGPGFRSAHNGKGIKVLKGLTTSSSWMTSGGRNRRQHSRVIEEGDIQLKRVD